MMRVDCGGWETRWGDRRLVVWKKGTVLVQGLKIFFCFGSAGIRWRGIGIEFETQTELEKGKEEKGGRQSS